MILVVIIYLSWFIWFLPIVPKPLDEPHLWPALLWAVHTAFEALVSLIAIYIGHWWIVILETALFVVAIYIYNL